MTPFRHFYVSDRSNRLRYRFRAVEFHVWPSELKDLALATIANVWDVHVGVPTQFGVGFFDLLPDAGADELATLASAAFSGDDGTFQFAWNRLVASQSHTSIECRVVETAAHEAAHAVQSFRGADISTVAEMFKRVAEIQEKLQQYTSHPLEVDASDMVSAVVEAYKAACSGLARASSRSDVQDYAKRWSAHMGGKPLHEVDYVDRARS